MTSLRVEGLAKAFAGRPPVVALDGVDLHVGTGALAAVLGPSGCGKSTLLRCIAGFERPDAGTITIAGRAVAGGPGRPLPPERRGVGIVAQHATLFPHLDVAGNIGFGLRRLDRRARRARVAELLDLVDLAGHERRRPHELSGGQQQRVALARALAPEPAAVLLDEPFGALDTGLRASVRDEVADLLRTAGTTAVLVTHDQAEAFAVADHLAVMRAGSIVQTGPPRDVYRRPVDLDTARFLGDRVAIPGRVTGQTVDCAFGPLPIDPPATPGPAVAVVRTEQIVPEPDSPRRAKVVDTTFLGPDLAVRLALHDLDLTTRWPADTDVEPGTDIGIGIHGPVTTYAPPPSTRSCASPAVERDA